MRRGGLVDPSKAAPFDQALCGLAVHLFRAALEALGKKNFGERLENCAIIFVNNPALNALALESESRRAIAIYMGTLHDARDEAWTPIGRFAVAIGNPIGRWHGDGLRDHALDLVTEFLKGYERFTKDLDAANVREDGQC